MNLIGKIVELFTGYMKELRKNVQKYFVSRAEIDSVIPKKLKYFEMVDMVYYTCDYKTMKKVCKLIPSRLRKYKADDWDCDNYAWQFKAIVQELFPKLPIGYVHADTLAGKHAMNCAVYLFNGNPKFVYIEPQTGLMYSQIQGTKPELILI